MLQYVNNMNERKTNPIMVIKGNQIEYVNESFISTFGKTKKDYISKEIKEAIPIEITSVLEELLQDHDKTKELKIKGKMFSIGAIIVKNGSAGNGSLGAIDYIRNYTKHVISIVSEESFEGMK